jgi:hypothetical protein
LYSLFIDSAKVKVSVRDVRYAWRSFRRAPLAALTIVTTVGLGLGLPTVVFTILNVFVFRVDEVRNPYLVELSAPVRNSRFRRRGSGGPSSRSRTARSARTGARLVVA